MYRGSLTQGVIFLSNTMSLVLIVGAPGFTSSVAPLASDWPASRFCCSAALSLCVACAKAEGVTTDANTAEQINVCKHLLRIEFPCPWLYLYGRAPGLLGAI